MFSIGSTFDSNTQAVPVRVNIYSKKDALIAGLYVEARIATKATKMKAVPAEAIVDDAGNSYIFTATKVKRQLEVYSSCCQKNKGGKWYGSCAACSE